MWLIFLFTGKIEYMYVHLLEFLPLETLRSKYEFISSLSVTVLFNEPFYSLRTSLLYKKPEILFLLSRILKTSVARKSIWQFENHFATQKIWRTVSRFTVIAVLLYHRDTNILQWKYQNCSLFNCKLTEMFSNIVYQCNIYMTDQVSFYNASISRG